MTSLAADWAQKIEQPQTGAIYVWIPGAPVSQGSLRSIGAGRVLHDNHRELSDFRNRVAFAGSQAIRAKGIFQPLNCAVAIKARFFLPRPKSVPKSRLLPHTKPDLDKLQRAIGDGLTSKNTSVAVLAEDSRIVAWCAEKYYADARPAGVEIFIHPADQLLNERDLP